VTGGVLGDVGGA